MCARVLPSLVDLFFPRTCIACGRSLDGYEKYLCLHCLADTPYTYYWNLNRNPMSDRFNEMIQEGLENGEHEPYAIAAALFFYRVGSGYENITRQLKYHGDLECGRHFAQMLGKKLSESQLYKDVDTLIPVPLHRWRKWSRGYNQAEVIALSLAKELRADVRTDILYRKHNTVSQTTLNVEQKKKNVKDAFGLRLPFKKSVDGIKKILLVDDVFTTGSTLCACHRTLREVFGRDVEICAAVIAAVG